MTGAVRHLAGLNAIADDCGLSRPKADQIVRALSELPTLVQVDGPTTLDAIATSVGCQPWQVEYVWLAWMRTDTHPSAR